MKRLKKRMLANRGFSYVITSVLMICVLLIGVAVFEVIRLYIQAGAVRDKFEDSIISMCVTRRCTSLSAKATPQATDTTDSAG